MRRRVLPWLLALCLLAGCGGGSPENAAEPAEAETPEAEETVSPVYTDWSQLTPYAPPEPVYSRFTPYSGSDLLQARDDYGPLIPYVGVNIETGSYMGALPLLGLATAQGRLVTDPVYPDVHMVRDSEGLGRFLVLYRGNVLDTEEDEWGNYPEGNFTYTVLAPDGKWVREFPGGDSYFLLSPTELALSCKDGSVTVLDTDGRTVAFFPREALEPYLGEDFQWTWEGGPSLMAQDGYLCVWRYDEDNPDGDNIACFLDPDAGTVSPQPSGPPRPALEYPEWSGTPVPEGYGWATAVTDPITGRAYRFAAPLESDTGDLLDESGAVVRSNVRFPYLVMSMDGSALVPWVWGDRICCEEDGCFCCYDLEGKLVLRYVVKTNSD